MTELDLTLRDGRTLHVYDEGDPQGVAVVAHHGTPSSGRLHSSHIDDARARGIRLIGYDRAGYGASSARPGRSIGDVAADVAELLDALGVERFATWGHSGGGPHALACAALLPERCVAASTLASVAPYGVEGLDWLDGMGEANVQDFEAVLAGPEALEPVVLRDQAEMFSAGPDGLRQAMLTILSPVDQAAFTTDVAEWIYAVMAEGSAERIEGFRDDNLACVAPWGFDPADIGVPVLLLQGVQDLMVPPGHGRWLAANIPGVEAEINDAEGHITLFTGRIPEVHEWLLARF
ncbi:MAG TPA: alpha/beta hydrolase [Gaiellaceae bacterium]